ncbi:hypothetical protein LCGC14_1082020 [marine sediment metagenome]|uniref:DUF8091 domain-containing protein n=1 Tax=marine sediment metagenome TaxID=412755 RepID=A0A0F9PY55_9ZZZZ|nr:MAG: hypothetical protein Lokiarch_22550 [Candidatus Lokiarchaeum sp. GC14_75]
MTEPIFKVSPSIGTLHESSLHAALKLWYKESEDRLEVPIENYVIDIVRDDLLIEIQTKNFSQIKRKLENLMKNNRVRLIYPIVKDKWILNVDLQSNKTIRKHLSPQHSSYIEIFEELIRIPELISNSNFTIEVLLVQIEEYRKNDGNGSWRRKGWSIYDRKLVRVLEKKVFYTPIDFLMLKPSSLKTPFTNLELAQSLNKPIRLARKMSYCLRKMGLIKVIGKKGRALLFDYQ